MKRLKIGVIDMACNKPSNSLWGRTMHANLASIMPQVISSWCEQEGHSATLVCYTGREDLAKELPKDLDLVFISAFTQAALLAYAFSNYFRSQGVVTVLGGPHARSYPDDALKYFDYVLGFTHKSTIKQVLDNCVSNEPVGVYLSAGKQPSDLCGVEERWKFIEPTLRKAPVLKMVPMLGSVGCPYTCSFCIDSVVPYQALDYGTITSDLRFLLTKFKKPLVGWHDPNFGVRFNENMEAISSAAPHKSFHFAAESSLSILTENHLKVLEQNGFIAVLPGIESWFEVGNKSRAARISGEERVNQISDHVNTIFNYLPYVQTNFVLGLDSDEGDAPFELTKMFVDRCSRAFPGYSLLTSFGESAPVNLEYQKAGRVLPFPFHFLNNHLAMNVKPKNYDWVTFYDKVIDLTEYTFSVRAIYRRFRDSTGSTSRWMNLMRAISSEGYGRLRFYRQIRENLVHNKSFRRYFEAETTELPALYKNIIERDLGKWWQWLPAGAIEHDVNAYANKKQVLPAGVPASR